MKISQSGCIILVLPGSALFAGALILVASPVASSTAEKQTFILSLIVLVALLTLLVMLFHASWGRGTSHSGAYVNLTPDLQKLRHPEPADPTGQDRERDEKSASTAYWQRQWEQKKGQR